MRRQDHRHERHLSVAYFDVPYQDMFVSRVNRTKIFHVKHFSQSLGWLRLALRSPPMTALSLRVRTDADFAGLADLWVASWQEVMPDIDFSARLPWFRDHLRALELSGAVTICAFDSSDRLLGFVNFSPSSAYLDQLAVAPEAKGSGAAQLLLDEARRLSPDGLVLDVNRDNARAVAFYERQGFAKIAEGVNAHSGLKTWRMRWSNIP